MPAQLRDILEELDNELDFSTQLTGHVLYIDDIAALNAAFAKAHGVLELLRNTPSTTNPIDRAIAHVDRVMQKAEAL